MPPPTARDERIYIFISRFYFPGVPDDAGLPPMRSWAAGGKRGKSTRLPFYLQQLTKGSNKAGTWHQAADADLALSLARISHLF